MYNNRVENSPIFRVMTNTTNVVKPTYPNSQSNVNGLQGPQGVMGEIGYDGDDGVQGCQGPIGLQGKDGMRGLQGVDGVQGNEGLQGKDGLRGFQGINGVQGSEGPIGQTFEKMSSFTDTQMYVSDIPLPLVNIKASFTQNLNSRIIFVSVNCEGNTTGEVTLEFNLKRKENGKENDFYPTMNYMMKKSSGAKIINLQYIDNHVINDQVEYILYAKGRSTAQIKILNSSIIVL